MVKLKRILIILPWFLLLLTVAVCIYRKDLVQEYIGDPTKPLYDSIDKLHIEIKDIHTALDTKNKEYDSLLTVDKDIIIRYHDKLKIIYSTHSASDLDSIIRASIKGKHRH